MRGVGYSAVLREPGVRWLLASSIVARLPQGMTGLAIVLRVTRSTGSYAEAGAVTAVFVSGCALLGPVFGRLADRFGRRAVLVGTALASAVALLLLSAIPVRATAAMFVVAFFAGAFTPPVAASVRSLWPQLAGGAKRDALYAMDSTFQELTFVVGPALVALLIWLAGTSAPFVASAGLCLLGVLALVRHSAFAAPDSPVRQRPRVASAALASLTVVGLLIILGCAVFQIAVVGYATAHQASDQSGLLFAVWSIGQMAGGFFIGARVSAAGESGLITILCVSGAGLLLPLASPGLPLLYPLMFGAGVGIVPALGCLYNLGGQIAPVAGEVEAFGWITSGTQVGIAGGAALGGIVLQLHGTTVTFALGGALVFAASCVALASKGTLTRALSTVRVQRNNQEHHAAGH